MKDDKGASTGATTAGVLKKIDDMKFLAVLHVLKLMLPHLSTLSKTFQSGELNFSKIKLAIEKTTHRIKKTKKLYAPFLWIGFNCLKALPLPLSSQKFLVLILSTSKG